MKKMEKNVFIKTDYEINAFKMLQIVFDDSDLVSIKSLCKMGDDIFETNLLFTFSDFNELIRFGGNNGKLIENLVCEKLVSIDATPHIISLGNEGLTFTTCNLSVSYIIENDNTCFAVEKITPISVVQQAKNLRQNIRDFSMTHLDAQINLQQSMQEIASMYRHYQGLLTLNYKDEEARKMAGLSNEKLFKMAFFANK
ncbi:MAG: hypothetical protein KA275_02260 [Chitinophagaceae bacterium]|nr:hypothetical protein [Chitinophagaceae bacterium]